MFNHQIVSKMFAAMFWQFVVNDAKCNGMCNGCSLWNKCDNGSL